MKLRLVSVSLMILSIAAGPATADMVIPTETWVDFGSSGETSLQQILNNITVDPTDSTVNVNTATIKDSWDSYWEVSAVGTAGATFIIELAGNANLNSFGIYDFGDTSTWLEIFSSNATAGDSAMIDIAANGDITVIQKIGGAYQTPVTQAFGSNLFGFYLGRTAGPLFYSDTDLNTDGFDHMRAYQGTGDTVQLPGRPLAPWTTSEFILAWEDLAGGGDRDYNDLVLMVESLIPVPVPAAVLLGMLGLGAAGLKLRKYA